MEKNARAVWLRRCGCGGGCGGADHGAECGRMQSVDDRQGNGGEDRRGYSGAGVGCGSAALNDPLKQIRCGTSVLRVSVFFLCNFIQRR